MKKKVLITTIPRENITLTARFSRSEVKTDTPEECFYSADSPEYLNGFTMPNFATQFIKANIPTIDILEYPTWDEYKEALKKNYDVVGISFWTYTSPEAIKMAKLARKSDVGEVWGGGHGVNTPGVSGYFDRIFTGYSEYEMKPLIEGADLTNFRHPVLISKYDYHLENYKMGFLYSIRGCRFSCSFCSGPRYYKRLALTPIEEIERILDIYLDHGIKHISIIDETFLQNKEHAKKVISALYKRKLTWNCISRVDLLQGNIEEMKKYGMATVYFGTESMNNLSLKTVKKGLTTNQTISLLRELESHNILAYATHMICFDQDTAESIKEDVEKLCSFKSLYSIVFWITTPIPGTEYYETCKQTDQIMDTNWRHYDLLHLVKKHPTMSPEEARKLLVYCVKNHCHELNIRKAKILRKWEKLESNKKF